MPFDLNTAKPVAPAARARRVRPGHRAPGQRTRPTNPGRRRWRAIATWANRPERPTNGVDVLGGKGLAGDAFDKVLGVVETPITMATGAVGGIAGAVAGLGKAAYKKVDDWPGLERRGN
jgi:hypothetical protein